jgi:hypothetical protein|tara:strand:+ start:1036 stop:1317 length:282 start_codon:yes stop_codon:yes gene_type:complete
VITIITKIELEGTDNLNYTDVGYTTDISIINEINEAYDVSLGVFLGENRTKLEIGEVSISTFFSGVSYVNEARTEVDTIEGSGLTEITNTNQL